MEENLSAGLDRALANFHDRFGERSTALLDQVQGHLAQGESRLAEAERQRAAAFGESLQATAGVVVQMREEMVAAGERVRQDMARAEAQAQTQRTQAEARDQALLQERAQWLERLDSLTLALDQKAQAQQQAIERLATSSTETLSQTTGQFQETLTQHGTQFGDALAQSAERFRALLQGQSELASQQASLASASSALLATQGDAFGQAVQGFQASTEKLLGTLQRIETALASASTRHDEQLAYYVAQAREVVDLSIASQQGVIENLRQLQGRARTQALAEGGSA
jgi:hypothetical protein